MIYVYQAQVKLTRDASKSNNIIYHDQNEEKYRATIRRFL